MRAPVAIGIVALFAWAHGLLNVWPLPPRTDIIPLELQWSLWWQSLLLTSLGLVAGILAVRSIRWWWVAIILTSGVVLVMNLPAMISDIGRAPSFGAWFSVIYDNAPRSALYFLLVVPLYHLGLVSAALIVKAIELGTRTNNETVA